MRNQVTIFFSFLLFFAACNKYARENKSLEGTWVEKTNRLDTLIVYRSNGKDIMFDNSAAYRNYPSWSSGFAFRYEYRLGSNKIGIRSLVNSDEFFWCDFRWIKQHNEFTMRYNCLRPYLSSIGEVTYTRVK